MAIGPDWRMDRLGWVPMVLLSLISACGSVSEQSDSVSSVISTTTTATATTTTQAAEGPEFAGDLFLTPGGAEIVVINGSPDLLTLLEWSYSRFVLAGIDEPIVEVISFDAKLPECEGLAGWISSDDEIAINVCLSAERLCRDVNGVVLTSAGKLCVLHELAHAWAFDNLTEETESEFMSFVSVDVWNDSSFRWHERGVEVAADTLAWGLMDQQLRMVRLSEPGYDYLRDGFLILTGVEPVVTKSFN